MLYHEGINLRKISKSTGTKHSKISHWIYGGNKPFIIRLLSHHIYLGIPKKGLKWVSLNSTRGGLLKGPWIKVPSKINNYRDVLKVIKQLNCSDHGKSMNSFAFTLGMLVGDASKTGIERKNRITRRIHLRLSKAYDTNEILGEFTSKCVNNLGLRMKRCKDCPPGRKNTNPFYTWISQSSMLIQWIFNICLGLKDNELTTYNPIKSNWILKCSKEFKIYFIQGLAESDGFIDFSSQQVGIITGPNTKLVKDILLSLGINSNEKLFTNNNLWSLMINHKGAYEHSLLNPSIKGYRYIDLEKLYKANRIQGHWPSWLVKKVENNIKEGYSGTRLVKKILYEDGIIIRTKNILRRKRILEKTNQLYV